MSSVPTLGSLIMLNDGKVSGGSACSDGYGCEWELCRELVSCGFSTLRELREKERR